MAGELKTQLAALLGHPVKQIRITDEEPPRLSAIDLATAITRKDANHAAQDLGFVKERYPEVTQILGDFKFRGQVAEINLHTHTFDFSRKSVSHTPHGERCFKL